MNKINLAFLSFFSIQLCSAQSAIFDLFESDNAKSKTEPTAVVTTTADDLTDQIVDNYTTQNAQKKPRSNSRIQNSTTLSPEQIQQKQTADLILAAQVANKSAAQAAQAANNLAAKLELLIKAQESSQKASQNNCTLLPDKNESINASQAKSKIN